MQQVALCLELGDNSAVLTSREPAVLAEVNGSQEGLAPEVVIGLPLACLSEAEVHNEPLACVGLAYEVAVTNALYAEAAEVAVCQHGIERAALVLAENLAAACARDHMPVFGAALRSHKVVPAAYPVQVRRFEEASAAPVPYRL